MRRRKKRSMSQQQRESIGEQMREEKEDEEEVRLKNPRPILVLLTVTKFLVVCALNESYTAKPKPSAYVH